MAERTIDSDSGRASSRWKRDTRLVWKTLSEWSTLARLVAVHILYTILAGAVLGPLAAWVIRILTKSGGDVVVSNFDLATFFLSLQGLSFLALTGTFALSVFFFEQSGMILVARSSLAGGRIPRLMEVLWVQKTQFPRLLRLGAYYFVSGLIVALPTLLVGGVCYLTMLSDRDINYYVSVKPPIFWKAVAFTSVGGLVTVSGLLWMYLRWFMALPILLLEGAGVRESIRRSSERSKGRALVFGLEVVGVAVLGVVVIFIMSFLLSGIDKLLLDVYAKQIHIVVIAGALSLVLQFTLTTVVTFLGFAAQCVLVSRHYLDTASTKTEPIDFEEAENRFGLFGLRSARSFLWLAAIVGLVGSFFVALSLVEEVKTERTVMVTAHRGSSVDAPENTLSALRLAMEEGADYAEIDIQINADDELVMIHDSELMRVSGVDLKVADMTRGQRLNLDVGAWFSKEFKGEPLPTLDEVIELVRGKMKLNIELKFGPNRKGLNRGVADLIAAKEYEKECVVTSLDYPGLKAFKEMSTEVRTGLIVTSAVGDITRAEADFLSLNAAQVSRSMIAAAEAQDKEIHVWTVNDPAQMHAMIDKGVDNILTDTPGVLVEILKQRAELSNTERLILQLRSRLAN